MSANRLYSPLRYPGGKAQFSPFISNLMESNNLTGGHYIEPYAGGAGIALNLLFNGYASHIHINDADPAIYAFWVAVTQHSSELIDLINDTPITMDEWFKWREVMRDDSSAGIVEKGFATLFINRTSRSGILNAGVIGGKNQDGHYKLDARFNKDAITDRILNIAKQAKHISVYCDDALHLLNRCHEFLPKKSLIYLDPPYYVKGKGLYRNYYKHGDHVAIADAIQNKNFQWPWIVSYDNAKEICDMYKLSRSLNYALGYSAQRHYLGNEMMFFSQNLVVPDSAISHVKAVA